MDDLLQLENTTPVAHQTPFICGPSPVKPDILLQGLVSHPDHRFIAFIHRGFQFGFRIGFNHHSVTLQSANRNHPSSMQDQSIISQHISNEIAIGRMVGPINTQWKQFIHTSPIALIPKPHQVGKWRLITDLSFPANHSINDGINEELCSLQYSSVDNAVSIIQMLGHSTLLIKIDLKDAYRMVPIHPVDQPLLGISWQDNIYIDRSLPFGLRSAPKVFSAVADAIAWVIHSKGVHQQLHYLDDFLFFGQPGSVKTQQILELVLQTLDHMGVPVASHKTEGPGTCVSFLGILIDTVRMELRLPADKLHRLQALVTLWVNKRSCVKKELESFLGHLSHAAKVIRPGRTFLRQLFILLSCANQPHHHIRLTKVAQADIQWWATFLIDWNGTSFIPQPCPSVHVFSDASGSWGCGVFTESSGWAQLQWPPSWAMVNITAKELLPIVLATAIWGHQWCRQHICFHCDNMAVVAILRSHSGRGHCVDHLLHCLFFYVAVYKFTYSVVHIPGTSNIAADALSRNKLSLFSSLYPQVPHRVIPQVLIDLLVTETPDWGSRCWIAMFRHSLREVLPCPPPRLISQDNVAI